MLLSAPLLRQEVPILHHNPISVRRTTTIVTWKANIVTSFSQKDRRKDDPAALSRFGIVLIGAAFGAWPLGSFRGRLRR